MTLNRRFNLSCIILNLGEVLNILFIEELPHAQVNNLVSWIIAEEILDESIDELRCDLLEAVLYDFQVDDEVVAFFESEMGRGEADAYGLVVVGTCGEYYVSVCEVAASVSVLDHFGCAFAPGGFQRRDELGLLDGLGLEDALLEDRSLLLRKGRL